MGMFIHLMVVIISQCTYGLSHLLHILNTLNCYLSIIKVKLGGRHRNLTTTLNNEIIPQERKKKSSENGTLHHLKSLSRTKEMMAVWYHFHLPLLCREPRR